MKAFIAVAVALVAFAAVCVENADGLDCYTCYHADADNAPDNLDGRPFGAGQLPHDKNCKDGKKPGSKLSGKCSGSNDVCFKITGDILTDGTKLIKGTARGCSSAFAGIGDKCASQDLFSSQALTSPRNMTLLEMGKGKSGNEVMANKVTVCACDKDDCNGASSMAAASLSAFAAVYMVVKALA